MRSINTSTQNLLEGFPLLFTRVSKDCAFFRFLFVLWEPLHIAVAIASLLFLLLFWRAFVSQEGCFIAARRARAAERGGRVLKFFLLGFSVQSQLQ